MWFGEISLKVCQLQWEFLQVQTENQYMTHKFIFKSGRHNSVKKNKNIQFFVSNRKSNTMQQVSQTKRKFKIVFYIFKIVNI